MLPRTCCPICLTRLNKTQWIKYHSAGEEGALVTNSYTAVCNKACSFQPPWCDKINYSHLPPYNSTDTAIDGVNEKPMHPDSATFAFLNLCRKLYFHRVDGRSVIQFARDCLPP